MKTFSASVVVLIGLTAATSGAAENWPQWRGPTNNGVAASGKYPTHFSSTDNVAWKLPLPGLGSSTPVVWEDNIVLTCGIGGEDAACCYNFRGEQQWQVKLGPERPGKHRNGSGSCPSPVTDGDHVFVYYKSGTVACLDWKGSVVWQTNLQKRYGKDTLWWDLGTSPVLAGKNSVVIAVMHEGESYLVALDRDNGEVVWKQPRNFECKQESDQSYTTPVVVTLEGRETIVTWGADRLTAHDAVTGESIWTCGGFNPEDKAMWRVIASPGISDGIAVIPYGRARHLAGVRLGGSGDVTETNRLWEKHGLGVDVPTPVALDGRAYLLTDEGVLVCLRMDSGKELWSAALPKNRSKFYSSPVLAGKTIYCTREDGMIFVGEIGDDGYKLVATNAMGERIAATLMPIRGGLLVRGAEHLFYITQ